MRDRWNLILAAGIVAMGTWDACFTAWGLRTGLVVELNPLWTALFPVIGIMGFIVAKVLLHAGACAALLWGARSRPGFARGSFLLMTGWYGSLLFSQLGLLRLILQNS